MSSLNSISSIGTRIPQLEEVYTNRTIHEEFGLLQIFFAPRCVNFQYVKDADMTRKCVINGRLNSIGPKCRLLISST
jgi:hypothetical protein